jgi:hypothetical protein
VLTIAGLLRQPGGFGGFGDPHTPIVVPQSINQPYHDQNEQDDQHDD